MKFTPAEVMQYVKEEEIQFIRLAFCDIYGKQKNIAIMASELKRAFEVGIAIDASAIAGFGGEVRSDLFLRPDPSTLVQLPWRPESGKVIRMFCDITYPVRLVITLGYAKDDTVREKKRKSLSQLVSQL